MDPRLAGVDYANNGSPATFEVDLPAAGTYNLSLAMGDDGYGQCWTQCQVQFLDGSTVLATVSGGSLPAGSFYDARTKTWTAAAWPGSNLTQQVTLTGTKLTVVVGSSVNSGDLTPIAFLGISQGIGNNNPNFTVSASPSALSISQGTQGSSTITTTVSGGFNSGIGLSATGVPSGTTVSFNPSTIPAPGGGTSAMTIAVGANTAVGSYPITVTGSGGGITQTTTVTLTVTASQPSLTVTGNPASLSLAQGTQGTSTITTVIGGGFNGAVALSAVGAPTGTTVSFNPTTIPAPGGGTSTMTIGVGVNTAVGSYPITVTASGGGLSPTTTVTLTVTSGSQWQQGFNFRATAGYVSDPSNTTHVLATTAYPTKVGGVTFGWLSVQRVASRDRSTQVDPRLAGVDYANNGAPATFEVDLPAAGTYNLSLAMGDDGYGQCWTQCQVQFLDGSTVLATVSGGSLPAGSFYDARTKTWTAAAWPGSNLTQQVTLTGTKLTVVVGSSVNSGDLTPIAFLGISQGIGNNNPNFTVSASPSALSIPQGSQGSSTITTTVSGGFNSGIGLSATGVPSGTTVSFNPSTIPAPGGGTAAMTIAVGANTATGSYPITVTGSGGGISQTTTVTLTVTVSQPSLTVTGNPGIVGA